MDHPYSLNPLGRKVVRISGLFDFTKDVIAFNGGGGFDGLGEGFTGGGDRVERRIFRTSPFEALREYFRGYFQARRTDRRQKRPFLKPAFSAFQFGPGTDYGPLA
jgi:hypothetical protein